MPFNRIDATPSRISLNQTRARTATNSSFGNRVAAGHHVNALQALGISAIGASELVNGARVSSVADRLVIERALRQPSSMGNFEIQELMSKYNQAEALRSNVAKKKDDSDNGTLQKIG